MITIDPFDFAAFIVYLVVIGALAVLAIFLSIKIVKLGRMNAQLKVDLNIYFEKLVEMMDSQDSQAVEETQGFLKFVSDSRDKAFEYIEDVQQALLAYDIALNTDDAKIINEAYKKLISFLPKDDLV